MNYLKLFIIVSLLVVFCKEPKSDLSKRDESIVENQTSFNIKLCEDIPDSNEFKMNDKSLDFIYKFSWAKCNNIEYRYEINNKSIDIFILTDNRQCYKHRAHYNLCGTVSNLKEKVNLITFNIERTDRAGTTIINLDSLEIQD